MMMMMAIMGAVVYDDRVILGSWWYKLKYMKNLSEFLELNFGVIMQLNKITLAPMAISLAHWPSLNTHVNRRLFSLGENFFKENREKEEKADRCLTFFLRAHHLNICRH